MKRILLFSSLIFFILMGGCSSLPQSEDIKGPQTQPPAPILEETVQEVTLHKDQPSEQQGEEEGVEVETPVPKGTIFAKTDFQGIVKASYVQLSIIDLADESKTYQLYIGDKARQQSFPWKIQTVQPGYFFINLPVGNYRIHSISIPVSTTVATEPMDITFEVKLDKIVYLGTLKVVGTKEKIKLGGVPLLKPGFEYTAELVDEREEAMEELRQRFQDLEGDVEVQLIEINRRSNIESPEENP